MTITRILDKKRMTTTGENKGRFHIKIRLTRTLDKRTVQKSFCTGIYATADEFQKIIGNPGKDADLQKKQSDLNVIYEKAKEIVRHNPFIDFDTFENQLTSKGGLKDPFSLFRSYIEELDEQGRIGTRDTYKQALSCFQEYVKEKCGGVLVFASITDRWLMRWEKWMLERWRTITTVRIYAICLRRIFNLAIKRYKIIPPEMYPFGEGQHDDKYTVPAAQGRKLALTEEQKNRLLKYVTLNSRRRKGVDFWIFSYFCNGMNMADICGLRFKDLADDLVVFDRVKTRFTRRNKKSIVVISRPEIKDIIERWGNKPGKPDDYVFPVLREGLTDAQVKDRVHDFIAEVNLGLKEACREDLNLPEITTYSARHTYATILKNKGASTAFLKEALGHTDERTTENYLDSFDVETKRKMANLL